MHQHVKIFIQANIRLKKHATTVALHSGFSTSISQGTGLTGRGRNLGRNHKVTTDHHRLLKYLQPYVTY